MIRIRVEEFNIKDDYKLERTGQIIQNEKMIMPEDSEYESHIKAFMLDEVKAEILKKS